MSEAEDEKRAKALVEEDLRRYYTGLSGLKYEEVKPSLFGTWYVRGNFKSERGDRTFSYEIDIATQEVFYRSVRPSVKVR